jgi:lipoprotein-releasing system permease protein
MSRLELSIAWRYLRSRRGSRLLSFISIIAIGGVVVGVSALIIVMGVMNGLQADLREKILVGSPDVRVLNLGADLKIEEWRSVLAKTRAHPGIVAAAPFVLTQALVNGGANYNEAAQIVGIEPEGRGVAEVTAIRRHATAGDFRFASSDGQRRGAVMGSMLAQRLNVLPGDRIRVVAPPPGGDVSRVFSGTYVPKILEFEVTGLFETGMYEYDNGYVYMALPVAQEVAGLDTAVTGIEARTADRWQAKAVGESLARSLAFPYRTIDWQEQNKSLFQALKLEKLGMGVILLLIVLVAAFNIVSTLTMVVTDKTREIGILKAMGMTGAAIRRVFLVQGLVIGFTGTLLGLTLGLAGSLALGKYKLIRLDPSVYFIDHLPVALEVVDVLTIVLASVAIAGLATLYPAAQAARLYPIEAIRHD